MEQVEGGRGGFGEVNHAITSVASPSTPFTKEMRNRVREREGEGERKREKPMTRNRYLVASDT